MTALVSTWISNTTSPAERSSRLLNRLLYPLNIPAIWVQFDESKTIVKNSINHLR